MSETEISRLTISSPLALRTLRLRLFLLTLVSLKWPEVLRLTSRCCGVVELGSRPRSFSGHSILITSAPRAPNQRVAHGPARTQLKSTTRIPSSARGRDMASFSCITGHLGWLWQTSLAVLVGYGRWLGEERLIVRIASGHLLFSLCAAIALAPIITYSLLPCIASPVFASTPTLSSCVIAAAHVLCPCHLASAI